MYWDSQSWILLHISFCSLRLKQGEDDSEWWQMTVKLPNAEYTLLLEVANVNKVIGKRCTRRACTLRWHSGHHGALRSRWQALLRASAVMSFWHSLGWCEVPQALTDTAPAIDWETPYGSLPLSYEGSWKALWATCSGMLWITRKVFFPAKYKGKNVLWT